MGWSLYSEGAGRKLSDLCLYGEGGQGQSQGGVGGVPYVVREQGKGKGVWGVCTIGTGLKLEFLYGEESWGQGPPVGNM